MHDPSSREDAHQREDVGRCDVPRSPPRSCTRLWRFDEVTSQPLHGNVHLVPSSPLSGRLSRATEARCLRIANLGVRTVLDLLINETDGAGPNADTGWGFMSYEDAHGRMPGVVQL